MKKKNNSLFVNLSIILGILLFISIVINIKYFYSKPKWKDEPKLCSVLSDSISQNDFEMSLSSDKEVYKTTEKIKIWTTLKYVGNKDKITIYHAGDVNTDTYFGYLITDGNNFNLASVTNLMLKSTTLDKNKVYLYDYHKSGGWDADAPDAEFWENFFQEEDLYLPAGEYTITAEGVFGLSMDSEDVSGLTCCIKIIVEE